MKRNYFFLVMILFFVPVLIMAQAPQSFKYQAIARNSEGDIISNKDVGLRISIMSGNTDNSIVYTENHKVRTSLFGLITLEIGNGKNKTGDFSKINWATGNYYVKVEIDVNGGTDFVTMGSSQLLSVPYALYAQSSGSAGKDAMSWTDVPGITYLTNPNLVGIGTTLPVSPLHVIGTGVNSVFERNISTSAGPVNRFYKSRGSTFSKTQIQAGDNMGQFQFWGMGDDESYDIGATLKSVAESTRTGTDIFDVAASIQFLTTNTSFTWGERMRITADGNVGIGTTDPAGILDIAGHYHFPNVDGSSGQVLRTDGIGNLTWENSGATQIDDLSDGKTGGGSVFLGDGAGYNDDLTNNKNVAVGIKALTANISGDNNTAIGNCVLYHNTIGCKNTSNGTEALYYNSSGNLNTAVGYHTLYSNTSGDNNTAVGESALFYNTTGLHNTTVGSSASLFNSSGSCNTAVGRSANFYNRTGSNNTVIGYQAGMGVFNNSFSGNILIGYRAGFYEKSDNKLYIENSSSSSPLIYGEFDNDIIGINGVLGVGTDSPDPSAAVEIENIRKGFLPPRMTTAERDAITNPAEGLQIFNVDTKCINFFTGNNWFEVCGSCTPQPTIADAGPDQTNVMSPVTLAGNTPLSGTGSWTILSGAGGNITDPSDPVSTFTGVNNTFYTLRWTISNTCGSSTDDVIIGVGICGIAFTDPRDGQSYGTVELGNQCWMSENLNIGNYINDVNNQTDNNIIEKYCYANDMAQCNTFGGMYQWDEIMDFSTSPGIQGICPTGWHIPTDLEWCEMENFVDAGVIPCGTTGWRGVDAGGNLKETGTTNWHSPNIGATNTSGFSAKGGGYNSYILGLYFLKYYYTGFWTSTEGDFVGAIQRGLAFDSKKIQRETSLKNNAYYLRCVKD